MLLFCFSVCSDPRWTLTSCEGNLKLSLMIFLRAITNIGETDIDYSLSHLYEKTIITTTTMEIDDKFKTPLKKKYQSRWKHACVNVKCFL